MFRLLCLFLFWVKGWKVGSWNVDGTKKYVITAMPHTSNWDFIFAIAVFSKLKIPVKFTIKKSWLKFPFGLIIKPLGAIGVDRSKSTGMVDYMADILKNSDEEMIIAVTPEGTRSRVDNLKAGFYHTALKAGVPIGVGYADYKKKEAGISKLIHLTGDKEKDLKEILAFCRTVTPKFPENTNMSDEVISA